MRTFLRWLLPIATFFGVVELFAWVVTQDGPTGLTGLIILGYVAALLPAWRLLDRGRLEPAVAITWIGIIVAAVLIVIVQPILYTPLTMIPLVAVSVALPHTRGRDLVRVLVVAGLTSVLIAALGTLNETSTPLPDWYVNTFNVGAVGAVATLVLVLLWQFSSRLTGALDEAVGAIDALTHAQDELEAERERLDTTLRSIGDGVIATDAAGRVAFLNAVAERLTGWSQADAAGQPFAAVFSARSEQTDEPVPDVVAQALVSVAPVDLPAATVLVDRAGAAHPVADSAAPIRGHSGEVIGAVVVFRDITAERTLEDERVGLERRIQETQKLESLGMLAGGVAHDFNNLLVAILGNASLALMDLPAESSARGPLEQIELASRRAADLAQAMLAYSGRGRFVITSLDLNALVAETAHLIAAAIPKGVGIQYDLASELPAIEGDATQIRQLVMNLVVNAGEAIGDGGGAIQIRTRPVDADAAYLSATFVDDQLPSGRYVLVEVSDNGPGMDEATRTKLFQPFFSTKFSGRGLGLAAVLGIVRGHGGAIHVYTEVGTGTTFKILFPVSPNAVTAGGPAVVASPPVPASGTVLVIDDDNGVRSVAGAILARAGMTVALASDGDEGVSRFREANGSIDLVFLDLTMPKLGGFETFEQIRALDTDVPIVLMSGYTEQEASARFVGRGLAGFLQKPFTTQELTAVLQVARQRPEPN
jgi:two-component system cell cycle sensor histidine kinase/response regulator CckA